MFKTKYIVNSTQVDPREELTYRGLLEICEYMGMEDLNVLGFPYEKTLKDGLAWVVASFSFNIYRLPKYKEEIEISTHPKKHSVLVYPRSYIFKDSNGKIIVEAEGEWALIDFNTRKIAIPSRVGIDFGSDTSEDKVFDYHIDQRDLVSKYIRKVVYSDLDVNNHVNNTKYAAWIGDILKERKDFKYYRMSFNKEIKLDDEVEISYSSLDNKEIYFIGKVNGEKRFEVFLGN